MLHTSIQTSLWDSFRSHEPKGSLSEGSEGHLRAIGDHELMYHAEVCTAATRYRMNNLQHLSLQKLHKRLKMLEPQAKQIPSFLDVLEYVYTDANVDAVLELRKMVLAYAAAKMHVLRHNNRFRDIMEENAKIGCDLVYEVSKHDHWN